MNTQELEQAAEQLKKVLTPEQIAYGQAVTVCSVVLHLGLQRASIEDVVDGLEERFDGMFERDYIQDVAEGAISFGLQSGLMEMVDSETFSLSSTGVMVGKNWLAQHQQAA